MPTSTAAMRGFARLAIRPFMREVTTKWRSKPMNNMSPRWIAAQVANAAPTAQNTTATAWVNAEVGTGKRQDKRLRKLTHQQFCGGSQMHPQGQDWRYAGPVAYIGDHHGQARAWGILLASQQRLHRPRVNALSKLQDPQRVVSLY
jgi:hypothetical protein